MTPSDTTLYLRFFARCAVLLGVLSLAKAAYVCYFYPVSTQYAIIRLSLCLAITIAGVVTLWLSDSSGSSKVLHRYRRPFIGSRLDGFLLFGSILAILVPLFFFPFALRSYRMALLTDKKLVPVTVRVNSLDIKSVSQEQFATESFYPVYNEVFYRANKIRELWVAFGEVTLLKKNGLPIEPSISHAIFTFPRITRRQVGGSNPQTTSSLFIDHHKIDAIMDSKRFKVGETYSGWLMQDPTAGVFFTRPSDRRLLELILVTSVLAFLLMYLVWRIRIGMKLQDRHWVELRKILNNQKT